MARYLDDARAVARTEALTPAAQRRVVPGLCRSAIEAACHEVVRARRLTGGHRHADVEAALSGCTTTMTTLALALFDDGTAGDRVFATLNTRLGRRAGDALRACREGAHAGHDGSLVDLVRDVDELVGFVRRSVVR